MLDQAIQDEAKGSMQGLPPEEFIRGLKQLEAAAKKDPDLRAIANASVSILKISALDSEDA